MAQAHSSSISKIILHDTIAMAQDGCSFGWAAQVFRCFAEHGKSSPLMAGAPVEVQLDEQSKAMHISLPVFFVVQIRSAQSTGKFP